ncbi:uncharacterized protein [Zea mays]|nr:uncharacterized protein LOC103628452 [Zea mays]XP_008649357.2 uncharacterized protein LOC103630039 [Zea mays]XP_008664098.2 uncharacterized protein LOC103642655 [Zea mays]XP_008671814.1 uncharacterized protein LOC103649289 [Zea mays]|eukprot:XP_008646872.1 uncharacterized protein LOC103628452 [Zea mays]
MADMVSEVAGQGARPALRWTAVMSGFVLRRFVDLIGNGVKTDKGFKEIHLNSVAKNVSEFCGQEVTGQQVYNHLRKWRSRWVKVCKLKDISGALWDEDNFVISLEEGHYAAYIKDHPKDADYLNRPIENYMPMQIIFGSGVATGKFAMGSNEPLGKPTDIVDILDDGIEVTSKFVDCSNLTNKGKTVDKGTPGESNDNKPNLGKRKRFMTDEDVAVFNGMKQAVSDVAAAVRESIHAEAAPGIYNAVINCPGFSREALMYALNHMMEHKATSLVFLDMTPDDRDLWLKTFLAKHYHN